MKKEIPSTVAIVALASVITLLTYIFAHVPVYEVHMSNSTEKCVRVVKYETGKNTEILSCDKLPNKYKLVWVQ